MMMCEEAKKLGLTTIVLDPSSDCPCSTVADELIVGEYNDIAKLDELGQKADLLSYEFENVDGKALEMLHGKYHIPQGIFRSDYELLHLPDSLVLTFQDKLQHICRS